MITPKREEEKDKPVSHHPPTEQEKHFQETVQRFPTTTTRPSQLTRMGLGKDLSLGGQGRDKGDRNDRTPMAKMVTVTAGETIELRGKQMGFWSALGERKFECRAGEVRRGQSMKAYVCHPTETGRSLLPGWQDACSGAMRGSSVL